VLLKQAACVPLRRTRGHDTHTWRGRGAGVATHHQRSPHLPSCNVIRSSLEDVPHHGRWGPQQHQHTGGPQSPSTTGPAHWATFEHPADCHSLRRAEVHSQTRTLNQHTDRSNSRWASRAVG